MSKPLLILLGILCIAGGIFGIVMTIMAVKFLEFGRVIFYGMIAILSLELLVLAFMKLKKS